MGGFTAYHSTDAVRGAEGKGGHTYFRVIMQMWNFHTHGLLEFGGLTRF